MFEEQDELDFPPPPPSFIHEPLSEVSANWEEMPTLSAQDSSEQTSLDTQADSTNVPLAPPLPVEDQSTVNFRRQLSLVNKDSRSKDLLCRHKSTLTPKEDANIPLVTPTLLQMVRLRSVNVGEDQVNDTKPSTEATTNEDHSITSQATPQKPIRKSLTLKSNSPAKSSPAPATVPSKRLQEAIRMKTAAMSSSGVPAMHNLHFSSNSSASSPVPSPKTPDGCDLHKSPASTASFIFSKSTKKVVIETPTSPEVQASLKQSLAAEIMQVSDQAKTMVTNGTKKPIKVPPPVAKKPVHGTNPPNKTENATPDKTEILTNKKITRVEVNGQSDQVHPAGQRLFPNLFYTIALLQLSSIFLNEFVSSGKSPFSLLWT
uniref:Uncharacterized protein n=1 Tax=Sinocyclocheilus anshuiensis TaxID=1608454 RepID=A0A671TCV3_9TELE